MGARPQKEVGDEKLFVGRFFQHGQGKPAHTKYCLTESCFDLLGSLFALCPVHRVSAGEALKHSFFTKEKPIPEWHAWHWDMERSEILRGDKMKRQRYDEGDARTPLKELSKEELKPAADDGDAAKNAAGGAKAGTVLDRWRHEAEKRKQAEAQRAAAERPGKKESGASAGGAVQERLPPGWTKHWSGSKQRYYYHNAKTKSNQWHAPE